MRVRVLLLTCALLVTAFPVAAQQVDVTASVPVRSPTGAGVRNLTFGTLTPIVGTTQTVIVPAAAAPQSGTVQSGEFRYNVAGIRGVTFNVTTPTQLTAPDATPLAVTSNGTQYGGYCVTTNASCTLINFNPAAGQDISVCRTNPSGFCHPQPYAGGNIMRVYVGGLLTVPPTARAGFYTGTVTLTIVQVY